MMIQTYIIQARTLIFCYLLFIKCFSLKCWCIKQKYYPFDVEKDVLTWKTYIYIVTESSLSGSKNLKYSKIWPSNLF